MTTQDTTLAHRYDCPTHDGKQCDNHCTFTPNQILTWHADDIATVTGESPATSLTALATQLSTASSRMEDAGINNAEDLDTASTYISDASNLTGTEQAVLLKQASDLLNNLTDMVDEYRDTV